MTAALPYVTFSKSRPSWFGFLIYGLVGISKIDHLDFFKYNK